MQKIIIYGSGEHAKVVLATVERLGNYEIIGILDDNPQRAGVELCGYPVLGGGDLMTQLHRAGTQCGFVAVGDNHVRQHLIQRMKEAGFIIPPLLDPSAVIQRTAVVGNGSLIQPQSYVAMDAVVGEGCIISIGVCVGHDSILSPYAQLSPGVNLAGAVTVGKGSFLGVGVSVLPRVRIGEWTTVGAGAVVTRDLPNHVVAVGSPARVIGS